MTKRASEIGILQAVFEVFGIVLVRFRPLQRIWGTWLVAVNCACLFFIGHVEAQVALVAVGLAVVVQALIYRRLRFVRILGATHVVWVPMLIWMVLRFDADAAGVTAFRVWLVLLIATNAISLAVDACDTARFAIGERRPSYVW